MSTAPRGPSKASYPWTGLATIRLSGCPLPRAHHFRGFFVRRWLVLESHIIRKIMMDKQYASMELALVDSMREGELAIVTVTPVGRPGATLDVKLENGRIQYLTMTKRMFERLLRGGGVAIVLRVVRIETAPNPLPRQPSRHALPFRAGSSNRRTPRSRCPRSAFTASWLLQTVRS